MLVIVVLLVLFYVMAFLLASGNYDVALMVCAIMLIAACLADTN